jgi:hypothetical protein
VVETASWGRPEEPEGITCMVVLLMPGSVPHIASGLFLLFVLLFEVHIQECFLNHSIYTNTYTLVTVDGDTRLSLSQSRSRLGGAKACAAPQSRR